MAPAFLNKLGQVRARGQGVAVKKKMVVKGEKIKKKTIYIGTAPTTYKIRTNNQKVLHACVWNDGDPSFTTMLAVAVTKPV
jgi:hypothetical protein